MQEPNPLRHFRERVEEGSVWEVPGADEVSLAEVAGE